MDVFRTLPAVGRAVSIAIARIAAVPEAGIAESRIAPRVAGVAESAEGGRAEATDARVAIPAEAGKTIAPDAGVSQAEARGGDAGVPEAPDARVALSIARPDPDRQGEAPAAEGDLGVSGAGREPEDSEHHDADQCCPLHGETSIADVRGAWRCPSKETIAIGHL